MQVKKVMVKFWDGPVDNGTLRDMVVLKESPVKKEEQQQKQEQKKWTRLDFNDGHFFQTMRW